MGLIFFAFFEKFFVPILTSGGLAAVSSSFFAALCSAFGRYDAYKNRIGKSYNDYIADHQMNMFEDFIGYQSSTVLDEPEREAGTTSIPIPQREESENIPSPDLPGQHENVQQSGNEIAERGMPT